MRSPSLFRVLRHAAQSILCRVKVPRRIGDDPFAGGTVGVVSLVPRHEGDDLAVLRVSDANTFFPAGVVRGARIGVDDIQLVVFVDVKTAWAAELLPFGDELAFGIEDLEAGIPAVADVDPPA